MAFRYTALAGSIPAFFAATAALLAAGAASAASPAQDLIEPGIYRITPVDPDSRASEKPRTLCVADANALLRLRHGNAPGCRDQFVQPGRNSVIVTYSCSADGWGRTELRREISGLYQLDTQGIAGKQPFAMRAEVRRLGDCTVPATGPGRH